LIALWAFGLSSGRGGLKEGDDEGCDMEFLVVSSSFSSCRIEGSAGRCSSCIPALCRWT